MDADAVAVYTPKGAEGILEVHASHGLTIKYIAAAKIPYGIGATGYAVKTGKPVTIENTKLDSSELAFPMNEGLSKVLQKLSKRYGALLVVPLIFSNGDIYGTLDLYYLHPHHFVEEELALAKAYADQTILAIENSRLRESDKKEAVNSERNRLARDLHDTVTQSLFSASLIADVFPDLWINNREMGHKALDELRQLTRGALAEMRTLLFELRPGSMVNAELGQLVKQLVDAFISRTRFEVQFEHLPIDCDIPEKP